MPAVPYTAAEMDPGTPMDVMDHKADFEISERRMDHVQGGLATTSETPRKKIRFSSSFSTPSFSITDLVKS